MGRPLISRNGIKLEPLRLFPRDESPWESVRPRIPGPITTRPSLSRVNEDSGEFFVSTPSVEEDTNFIHLPSAQDLIHINDDSIDFGASSLLALFGDNVGAPSVGHNGYYAINVMKVRWEQRFGWSKCLSNEYLGWLIVFFSRLWWEISRGFFEWTSSWRILEMWNCTRFQEEWRKFWNEIYL